MRLEAFPDVDFALDKHELGAERGFDRNQTKRA
jgi:hypothetical protein